MPIFQRRRAAGYSEQEVRLALQKRLQLVRALRPARRRPAEAHTLASQASSLEAAPVHRPRSGAMRLLLSISEAGLVVLIGTVTLSALVGVGRINQKTRESWQAIPATPTALVTPMQLPSGHAPAQPAPVQAAREIFIHGYLSPANEIPAVDIPPAPVSEFATRLRIPAIAVDAPVVQGVEKEQLKKGVGQIPGTANPGEAGNMVLSAHNDVYGELFRYLDRLKPGDVFTVSTNRKAYTYVVTGIELVEPERIDVLAPTLEATATLISCYPYLIDSMRIVVKARLLEA